MVHFSEDPIGISLVHLNIGIPHKLEVLNNVNLSEYFWVIGLGQPLPSNILLRESIGFLVTGIYLFVLPVLLAKTVLKKMYEAILLDIPF